MLCYVNQPKKKSHLKFKTLLKHPLKRWNDCLFLAVVSHIQLSLLIFYTPGGLFSPRKGTHMVPRELMGDEHVTKGECIQ